MKEAKHVQLLRESIEFELVVRCDFAISKIELLKAPN